MIITKYPDDVETQLKLIDEQIEKLHKSLLSQVKTVDDEIRIRRNLYEITRPLIDEKVRLIMNCNPTYIIEKNP